MEVQIPACSPGPRSHEYLKQSFSCSSFPRHQAWIQAEPWNNCAVKSNDEHYEKTCDVEDIKILM